MLTSFSEDLVAMFKESIDGTIELITQQLMQVDQQNERVKVRRIFIGFCDS